MILSVSERLILLNILPAEGDITALRIVRDLKNALSFSEEEHAALKFVDSGTSIKWEESAAVPKEVEIGAKGRSIIQRTLQDLNTQKKLHFTHLDLYERFCPEE